MEIYEVKYVQVKQGTVKVRYTVTPSGGEPEESIVSRSDKVHEDFRKAWKELRKIAARFLEFPLQNEESKNLHVAVTKVNFLQHKDCGDGMQLVVLLQGFTHCREPLQVVTHKFYECAVDSYLDNNKHPRILQQLLPDEIEVMEKLKDEAFAYAYYCKREQPTVDEAQAAYEAGGYPDKKRRK